MFAVQLWLLLSALTTTSRASESPPAATVALRGFKYNLTQQFVNSSGADFLEVSETASSSCQPDGHCDRGNCCSGRSYESHHCGLDVCHGMCTKLAKDIMKLAEPLVRKAIDEGDDRVGDKLAEKICVRFDLESDTLCEAVGAGPEDPLADLCAAAVTFVCPKIVSKIITKLMEKATDKIDPASMCTSGPCDCTGQKCGCLPDGQCSDHTSGCCSGRSHHSFKCLSQVRCGCLSDGQCTGFGLHGREQCCSGQDHFDFGCAPTLHRCGPR